VTKHIVLAAPTGRAAKRMSEVTGVPASTIHSVLSYDFQMRGFKYHRQNPLIADLIIIDEASMLDTYLMASLINAISDTCKLIFIGDPNQLPSVGPGNVLKDLIACGGVPYQELRDVYRQSKLSQIITSAHAINIGKMPDRSNAPDSDFFFMTENNIEALKATLISLLTTRLPDKYQLNPLKDIQVLTPQNKGCVGTVQLNQEIQAALNPNGVSLEANGNIYRLGDKVMQIRNNYQKEVMNGDVGYITGINLKEKEVLVEMDVGVLSYQSTDLDELTLAYAVTVHKFQGSECPCIIMPVHTIHYQMLHRNLLYTGVTRGKQLVILIGTTKALGIAVNNNDIQKRYTGLQELMQKR